MGGRVLFALSIAAFPEDFPRGGAARPSSRRAGGEGPRGRRDRWRAVTPSRIPSRSTAWRSSAPAHPDRLFRKGGARARRRAAADEAARAPGCSSAGSAQGRTSDADLDAAIDADADPEPAPRPRSSSRHEMPRRDRHHRASACWATAWRWRAPQACGSCFDAGRAACPATGPWTWPAAGRRDRAARATTGGSRARRSRSADGVRAGAASPLPTTRRPREGSSRRSRRPRLPRYARHSRSQAWPRGESGRSRRACPGSSSGSRAPPAARVSRRPGPSSPRMARGATKPSKSATRRPLGPDLGQLVA